MTTQEILDIVAIVKAVEEETKQYLYIAIMDAVTCSHCLSYEQLVFNNDEIPLEFPYAEEDGDNLDVLVHPNCRCLLVPYNLGTEETEAVSVNKDGDLVNKESSDSLPTKISDAKYEDFLNALADAGVISLGIYQLIMDRRNKQKKQPTEDSFARVAGE
jgi:hypothetical protein